MAFAAPRKTGGLRVRVKRLAKKVIFAPTETDWPGPAFCDAITPVFHPTRPANAQKSKSHALK